MVHRYSLKNKVARAGFYVTSIGGLMMLFAGLLWLSWNHFVADNMQYAPLSFLESVGLVSIAYIVYSSLRFSSQVEDCGDTPIKSAHQQPSSISTPSGESTLHLDDLSGSQREQLKLEIERCCGKRSVDSLASSAADQRQA